MENREQVIEKLVNEFGCKASSFNNTPTNKQREKFWTFNRLLNYLRDQEDKRDNQMIELLESEDFGAKDMGYLF
jgi:hypothetical protein